MKRSIIFWTLMSAALVMALSACRKKHEPNDSYDFDQALTADSVTVSVAANNVDEQTATIRMYLFVDNNVDSVNTENQHIIESIFAIARLGGIDHEYVLATGANNYKGKNNERVNIGDYENILIAEVESLRKDPYDQRVSLVFTGSEYLRDDVEFVLIGYDQEHNATGPYYINKQGRMQSVPFFTVEETQEPGRLY
ncbi:MAG: hypothetical protein J6Z12_02455 [Paludibacteraceae bacterium]|nr:hypothetical protein [Paludibacteraceae bacterium]